MAFNADWRELVGGGSTDRSPGWSVRGGGSTGSGGNQDWGALGQTLGAGLGGLWANSRINSAYGDSMGRLQSQNIEGARTPFFGSGLTAGTGGNVTPSQERSALIAALSRNAGAGLNQGLYAQPGRMVMDPFNMQDTRLQQPLPETPDFSGYMGGLNDMAGVFGQQAMNPADYGGQDLVDMGVGMFGEDFSALRAAELQTLRDQAAPFEERAFDDLQNRQYSMGQLGTTGGGLQTEAFARGLAQADLGRQLAATQTAQGQYGLNTQRGSAALGAGSGLIGMGANQQLANAGMYSGLVGQGTGLMQQGYGNQMANMQYGDSRGQQRISNALGIFNTENDVIGRNLQSGMGLFGGLQQQDMNEANINQGLLSAGNTTYYNNLQRESLINNLAMQQAQESGGFLGSLGGAIGGGITGFMTGGWGGAAVGAIKGAGW